MDNASRAMTLVDSLSLTRPPIGLAFVSSASPSIKGVEHAAPSACTFWRRAETDVFFATAADHAECPIGVLTMGFEPSSAVQQQTQETLGLFTQLDYFSLEEVAHLPTVSTPHVGIVYGPLADLPVAADVILVVATPRQAMVIAESGGTTALADVPQLAAMGRPACAVIPRSINARQSTMSLGCIGARTYAEIPDDQLVVAIPADRLDTTIERLGILLNANRTLASIHANKMHQFASASH